MGDDYIAVQLNDLIREMRPEFQLLVAVHKELIESHRIASHPGKQRLPGGLQLHMLQVTESALELNQSCNRQEVIECCIVHDLPGCEELPLTDAQRLAIAATKGQATYKDWRPTPHFRFVVLILIADMWSAFINEQDWEHI